MVRHRLAALTFLAAFAAAPCAAADWPQWRGPHHNGTGDAAGLPATWSKTEGVAWVLELPGNSPATPAVVKDHVFVTAVDEKSKELLAIAVERKTGKEAWRKAVGLNTRTWQVRKGLENTMATPSPIADGERAIFLFGSGGLVAFATDGKELWKRDLVKDHGPLNFLWGYGASPLLYKGKLYVPVLHRDTPIRGPAKDGPADSYLLAVDPRTGKDLWKHARASEAKVEAREAYSTPIPREDGGRSEILVVGGDCVTGHDPETGKELWRWGEWNPKRINHWRLVTSVLAAEGLVFVSAPKKEPFFAVKSAGTAGSVAWSQKDCTPDVCTPLYFNGRVYVLDGDRKLLNAYDPKSGEKKGSAQPPGKEVFRASPTAADGKIFCINEDGTVSVLDPESLKVTTTVELGEGPCRASIAPAGGALYIRTAKSLYCVGKP
jgi:YVTN family beta-propeller protein